MSWGFGSWGTGLWGGAGVATLGANPPVILQRTPFPNDTNVGEGEAISIVFFDPDGDLDPSSINVTIDGVLVYNGSVFSAGFTGGVFTVVGRTLVRVIKLAGWGYDTAVRITASASDLSANSVVDTWTWRTRTDPVCYTGISTLPIERLLLTPLTTFLELEVIRRTMLDNALRTRNVPNSEQRAARVVYQLAFDTEINTVLNAFELRDEPALASTVCERQASLRIAEALVPHKARLIAGIQSLQTNRIIPKEYAASFQDYLENVQYAYRVSLAANLVLLAHSVEAYGT